MGKNTSAFSAIALGLIFGAFVFGVYVGEGRVSADAQVAQVAHMNGDVPTLQVAVDPVDLTPYWRVWNTLERKFIPFGTSTDETVAPEERLYSSIEGLVRSYNDPYTVFMRPQVSEDFKIATQGSLEGIGAVIGGRDGKLLVVQPLQGSPAEKAGLVTGDHIQKINDVETSGMNVEDAVHLIRGEGGTEVVLFVQSAEGEAREVPIVRGKIEIPSTAHAVVEREVPVLAVHDGEEAGGEGGAEQGGVGEEERPVETELQDFYFLRLFSFSQTSINAFERELREFTENGSDSLIIDLRGNPGGYLEAAVNIAGWFLPDDTVVVKEYRGPEKREILHRTQSRPLFTETKPNIAILVDKGSASASEILAGALQEHGVATVIGVNTYGKGSVQELINISDDLSLKVTVSRWYTPNGVSISQGGLTPDIIVDIDNASSTDPYVDAAIEYLSGV